MKLAVVQTSPVFGNTEENLSAVRSLIQNIEADLFVLPEFFNTGYNFASAGEVDDLAEPQDGTTFRAMHELAREKNTHLVYGFPEKADHYYNSALLVGPQGLIGLYRKVHLYYRETLFFAPGNLGFPVFSLPFGKVGIMICFDWIFPESARSLALSGAQLIAHPSNLVLKYCPDAMITRCLENRVFAATSNRTGREERGGVDLKFTGNSEIVSPAGEVLCRMAEEVGVSVADIHLPDASSKRMNEYNDLFADRTIGQYRMSQ